MLRPGLVSITFRQLQPRAVIDLCVANGLQGIEWGGDVHVPHGDTDAAGEVSEMMHDAGLAVAAYGSYYRCDGREPFEPVLETAVELGAPCIRVWAGRVGSNEAVSGDWEQIGLNLSAACGMAAAAGIKVVTEYHGNTLTDTRASTRRLLNEVHHPDLQTLWQPLRRVHGDQLVQENLEDLRDVLPSLANVHVYEWFNDAENKTQRLPLNTSGQWDSYIAELKANAGHRWLLLEFVPGDDPSALALEAQTLRQLIAG